MTERKRCAPVLGSHCPLTLFKCGGCWVSVQWPASTGLQCSRGRCAETSGCTSPSSAALVAGPELGGGGHWNTPEHTTRHGASQGIFQNMQTQFGRGDMRIQSFR